MQIRPFQRFQNDDYKAAPSWFWDFLGNLNQMVDTLNAALQNNLDIDYNFRAERQTVKVSHNVPVTLNLRRLSGQPRMVRLGYASGYQGTATITGYNTDGSLQVTVFFLGTAPTTPQTVTLVFEP